MYKISNFSDNDDVKIIDKSGPFEVIEYQRDLSVMPEDAQLAFFCSQMNVRKRQLKCELSRGNVTIQSGAMQWMAGDVSATTGIKGAGDFLSKTIRGKVTGESVIKPEYTGDGTLVLEPTYKHIILLINYDDINDEIKKKLNNNKLNYFIYASKNTIINEIDNKERYLISKDYYSNHKEVIDEKIKEKVEIIIEAFDGLVLDRNIAEES